MTLRMRPEDDNGFVQQPNGWGAMRKAPHVPRVQPIEGNRTLELTPDEFTYLCTVLMVVDQTHNMPAGIGNRPGINFCQQLLNKLRRI